MRIVIQSEHRLCFYLEMGKSYVKMSGSVDMVINLLKGKNSTKLSLISLQQAKEPYTPTYHIQLLKQAL